MAIHPGTSIDLGGTEEIVHLVGRSNSGELCGYIILSRKEE